MKPILQLILRLAAMIACISSTLYDTLTVWFNFQGFFAAIVLTLFVIHKHYNKEVFDSATDHRRMTWLYWCCIVLLTARHYFAGYSAVTEVVDVVFMLIVILICEMLLDHFNKK
jgi:hypothetical protein